MGRYSIIDISSSSISMLTAHDIGDELEILDQDRRHISMLSYLEDHELSARGLDKMIDTILALREKSRKLEADDCHVICTAAMRHIVNLEEVRTKVLLRTGAPLTVLDGTMEAYCDYVANTRYMYYDRPVLVDVGGASVEICDFSKRRRDEMDFLDFGSITIKQRFVAGMQPDKDEAKAIKKYVRTHLETTGLPGKDVFATAILVGSTTRSLYELYEDKFSPPHEEEKLIEYKKLKKLTKYLVESPNRSRLILKHAPEKIHILTVSAIILKEILRRFELNNIVVSDYGVKEGYLKLLLAGEVEGAPMPLYDATAPDQLDFGADLGFGMTHTRT